VFKNIDKSWTLFLDRDGVINERIPGQYISNVKDLRLTPGCRQAIASFNYYFGKTLVVTNQAGIGKGLMTTQDLEFVHNHISKELAVFHAQIHRYYHCSELANTNSKCRKPATGMALQALKDFPEIDFSRSVMVGDSHSDMEFGKTLGMKCILIEGKKEDESKLKNYELDGKFANLFELAQVLNEDQNLFAT